MSYQPPTDVHADRRQAVTVAIDTLPWLPSPLPGVSRRILEREGSEVARATSIVRYDAGSRFDAHEHTLGEEYLVLDGVFSDEHGDHPRGTYVRNPPGSRHTPASRNGCTIFVKLRQMHPDDEATVIIDTGDQTWQFCTGSGHRRVPLFARTDGSEFVTMEHFAPGAELPSPDAQPGGEELLLLEGDLEEDGRRLEALTWQRTPAKQARRRRTASGCLCWIKRGHLPASNT